LAFSAERRVVLSVGEDACKMGPERCATPALALCRCSRQPE
jgi:hypothetical protein